MCCEHLVCARCARPVSEGACPVCRAARSDLHAASGMPLSAVIMLAVLLAVLATVLSARLSG